MTFQAKGYPNVVRRRLTTTNVAATKRKIRKLEDLLRKAINDIETLNGQVSNLNTRVIALENQ